MFFTNYCKLCKEKNMTPTGVAVELGISRGTVSAWKNKDRLPQASQLQKIADYFGVTVDALLSENGEGKNSSGTWQDEELMEYLEGLKEREDMRILFSLAKNATKEEVMQAVKIIEALRES